MPRMTQDDMCRFQRRDIPREVERIRADAQTILDRSNGGTLSDEDRRVFDDHMADLDLLRERDESLARLERLAAVPGALVPGFDPAMRRDPRRDDDVPRGRTERHTEAARLLARSCQHLGDEMPERLSRMVEADESPSVAEFVLAAADPHYARAFQKLARNPHGGEREFTTQELAAYQRAAAYARGLNLTNGSELLPTHLDPSLIIESDGSIDPIRSIARRAMITTDQWNGATTGGVVAEWLAEEAEAADATPVVDPAPVPVHKASAFVPISIEAFDDLASIQSEIRTLFADSKADHEAKAWVTGTGVGQPKGFITALDGTASEVAPTTAETFASPDVYKVQNALPARFQARARWAAALPTINEIQQMESAAGARLFPEIANDRLLRRPLHEVSSMKSTDDINPAVTADNHVLVYGDWRHYLVVDRVGMTVELIPTLFGPNRRPTGQRGWFMFWRVGGDVLAPNAFRVLNVATTL